MCSNERKDLASNGSVLATALYGPYGVGRYATGTMPTSKAYTGQRQDSGSGLDYYGARYYDAAVGQFTSADSVHGPNRYAYVGGNPETATDPTGKVQVGDPGSGAPPPVTDLPNYWSDYQQFYWSDQCAGQGCYHPLNDGGADAKQNPIEDADGRVLSKYFGLTVDRIPEGNGTSPDFNVAVDFGNVENPGLGADYVGEKYATQIELLTPKSSSQWEVPDNPRNGGVVKTAYDKARRQSASIMAIDLRYIDPDGKLSTDQLRAYATTIMFWGAPVSRGPSQVMRVLFIRGDSVIDIQANPQDPYGPPPSDKAPPRALPVPVGDVPEVVPDDPIDVPPIDLPPLI